MLFWILVIAAFIFLTLLFFAVLKGILKALVSAIGVICVIAIGLGVYAIIDARDFVENSKTPGQLFILEESGAMLAGMKDPFINDPNATRKLTIGEFRQYSAMVGKDDYEGMLENNSRVFVVNLSAFDGLTDNDLNAYQGLRKDEIFGMLRSKSAVMALVDKTVRESNVSEAYKEIFRRDMIVSAPEESDLRSTLFMVLLDASIRKQGPLFLVMEIKNGKAEVYPRTIFFRAIDIIPLAVFEKTASVLEGRMKKE